MDVALQGGQSSDGTAGESLRRQLEDVLRARENERSVYVRHVGQFDNTTSTHSVLFPLDRNIEQRRLRTYTMETAL